MALDLDAEDRRRDRRALLVVLVVVVLLVGVVYAAGLLLTSDKLPRGTRVGEVRVGGLSPAAARRKVAEETAALAARPVELVVDERSFRLRPDVVGLEVDVSASVAQVPTGRSWDPRDMWEALVGSTEVPLVTVTVGEALERRVDGIADRLDEPVVEGAVELLPDRPRAVYPQAGRLLDRRATVAAVQAAYPSTGQPVVVDLTETPPAVSSGEVSRLMRDFANPAYSGRVTYRFGRGVVVVVQPQDFAPALSVTAVDGRLRPALDADRLWELFGVIDRVYADRPDDTRRFGVEGRVLRAPAVAGFLREEVADGFLSDVRRVPGRRTVEIPVRLLRR